MGNSKINSGVTKWNHISDYQDENKAQPNLVNILQDILCTTTSVHLQLE